MALALRDTLHRYFIQSIDQSESQDVRHKHHPPLWRRGARGRCRGAHSCLDWCRHSGGLGEPLVLELGVELGLEIITRPERRDELLCARGITREDLREQEQEQEQEHTLSAHTFA